MKVAVVERKVEWWVPTDLACFPGHFPQDPLLPGAALPALFVLPELRALAPELGRLTGVSRLKFSAPVRPGERLRALLRIDVAAGKVEMTVEGEAGLCASALLGFSGLEQSRLAAAGTSP